MRSVVFLLAAGITFAADGGKWVAPLAPRHVDPPQAGVHPIDAFLHTGKSPVSDAVFARRAYLDLWGLLPTPAQLSAFEKDTAKDKRDRLIDTLLAHKENYSAHWISFWNDLLRNDEGVIYHGERKSITPWLKRALEDNLPYDRFVAKLLNPTEKTDPDGFLTGVTWRGVVNASELPPMQAAQNSAQIFLGINLKCNSCHDSFISTWKLKDAYGLAAFFSDGPLELVRCDVPQGKTAETKFLFPELGPVQQGLSLADRHAAAAKFFTDPQNGRLTRTYVNRIWGLLFGKAIVPNVDDMAARPWNADLLDWLAADFAANGYDTKRLLKTIMTSRAYQLPAVIKDEAGFAGPQVRRLSAEQLLDAVASITGEWRTLEDKSAKTGIYSREWRFKSSPLTRALGHPIRDQVTTVRLTQPTTLQALELVNGNTLASILRRGSARMLGELPAAPKALFDSGTFRGAKPKPVDLDISGLDELWLLMTDVDSYDPGRVKGGFRDAELIGPAGSTKLPEVAALALPFEKKIDLRGKGFTRLRANISLTEESTPSDINGTVRFYAYSQQPDRERMLPATGQPPVEPAAVAGMSQPQLIGWLYRYALAREASAKEIAVAREILGKKTTAASLEDLLWVIAMSPEFQYIR